MNRLSSLRDGRVVALLLVVALALLVVLNPLFGTHSAFTAKVTNSTNTVGTAAYFSCSTATAADKANAYFIYPANEASGSTSAADTSGTGATGTYQGTMTTATTTPIACPRDTGGAYVLNGTSSYLTTPTKYSNPTTFSLEAWFKTTTNGGEIIGFGASQTGANNQYDRFVYITNTGKISFGTYNSGYQILTSPNTYTDGKWHHVVAELSPTAGMSLYLDGTLVASNSTWTAGENASGYWRAGYESTGGWANDGGAYFTGSMRYIAAYKTALTQTQVTNHYQSGT